MYTKKQTLITKILTTNIKFKIGCWIFSPFHYRIDITSCGVYFALLPKYSYTWLGNWMGSTNNTLICILYYSFFFV